MAGLGLWFVYSLITRWGGFIEAESEPNKGTCIKMYLQMANQRSSSTDANSQYTSG